MRRYLWLVLTLLFGCDNTALISAAHDVLQGADSALSAGETYGAAQARLDCMFYMNATGPSSNELVIYREVRFLDGSGVGELTVEGLGFVSKYSARGRQPSTVVLNEIGPPDQVLAATWHNDGDLVLYTDTDGGYTQSMSGICTGYNLSAFGI